ncbi:MAG: hypothetical protein EHM23_03415 [Acidobacteria bacterium]|nr:MAG: hypothetical protein EHM23_03415 [Acidobacteriota bacterium]
MVAGLQPSTIESFSLTSCIGPCYTYRRRLCSAATEILVVQRGPCSGGIVRRSSYRGSYVSFLVTFAVCLFTFDSAWSQGDRFVVFEGFYRAT